MAQSPYPLPRETRSTAVLVCDGVSATYGPFSFKIFDEEDVAVEIRHAGESIFSETSAVTVTKTSGETFDTFSITFDAVHPATSEYVVRGSRTPERDAAVSIGGGLSMNLLERELSKIAIVQQELRGLWKRLWKVDAGSEGKNISVPVEAGHVLVTDADGNLVDGGVFASADEMAAAVQAASDAQTAADQAAASAATVNLPNPPVNTNYLKYDQGTGGYIAVTPQQLADELAALPTDQVVSSINGGPLGGLRNKIINGAALVIERGSKTIAAGSSGYVFDCWLVTNDTDQDVTVTRYQLALGSGFAPGGRYVMRHTFSAEPNTGEVRIEQRLEDVTRFPAGDWTLTAWMTGPSGSEAVTAEVVQNFGTGGSPSGEVPTAMIPAGDSPTTIYDASTNRRCWGVTIPSMSGKILGTADDYLAVAMVLTPRQAGNYDLTWVSFVEGNAASENDPYEDLDGGTVRAMCAPFYQVLYGVGWGGFSSGSTVMRFEARYPPMRKNPTPVLVATAVNILEISTPFVASSPGISGVTARRDGIRGVFTGFSGLTTGNPITINDEANKILALDASLY